MSCRGGRPAGSITLVLTSSRVTLATCLNTATGEKEEEEEQEQEEQEEEQDEQEEQVKNGDAPAA